MFCDIDYRLAGAVLDACQRQNLLLAGAESCTGGLVSALLTSVPGSSSVFSHSHITYSYAAKINILGVSANLLSKKGAVAGEVACAMAHGTRKTNYSNDMNACIGYAITGVAGPGFSERKPCGLVFIAISHLSTDSVHAYRFAGNREAVRLASVRQTLCDLLSMLS